MNATFLETLHSAPRALHLPWLNLVIAWAWVFLGFLSGMLMGLKFDRENWLGGYSSFRRRLYRLGHISFFGLGGINFLFYYTTKNMAFDHTPLRYAAWALIIGAVTMPLCCLLMAHLPRCRPLFSVPVISLLAGAAVTVFALVQQPSQPQSSPGLAVNDRGVSVVESPSFP